jgi:Winged helix DNA-binding domain
MMTPVITARRLNRATLARQLLLQRADLDAAAAVHRVVALQAQEPASPYVALWNRLRRFDPAQLDAAFSGGAVVKATLLRITLHAVHAEDYPAFHRAMLPTLRAARLGDTRFTVSGLSIADADALLPRLLERTARPHTAEEVEEAIATLLGGPRRGVWWALRTYAPLLHVPTGGPWSFDSRAFVTAPEQVPPEQREAAARHLVLRYLTGFGPATASDIRQFTLLAGTTIKEALRSLGDEVEVVAGPGGTRLHDVAGAVLPDEDVPAPPRLLGMWDSILLAYADRSRTIPPEYRRLVTRVNGDCLPSLLVDGRVAGVWRAGGSGIEAKAFHPLPDGVWEQLAAEAAGLTAFLADRDPAVYRRYGHWWDKLPGGEVRRLS